MPRAALSVACLILLALCDALTGASQQSAASAASPGAAREETTAGSSLASGQIAVAKKLLAQGRPEQAISLLRALVTAHPEDGDAHLLLGIALSAIPRRDEALQQLERGVALEPGSAVAWFSLGNAEARFADTIAARKAFETAVKLDPKFFPAHISLALVLAQQNQLEAARVNLMEAIRLIGDRPSAAHAHFLLAQLLIQQGHPHQALAELDAAVTLRPGYAEAYLNAGMIRKHLLQDQAAAADFRKAAEISPQDAEAQYQLGSTYLRLGAASEAVEPLRKTVAMRPGDRKALYQLCRALQRAGRKEDALSCQKKLSILVRVELATADHLAEAGQLNNEGIQLEKSGNPAAAIGKYQQAVELDPNQAVFRRNLALALCRQGRWNECGAELKKVLKQNPNDSEATRMLYIALDRAARN
jgi:tetratricopeptide (TPR) repeat protein